MVACGPSVKPGRTEYSKFESCLYVCKMRRLLVSALWTQDLRLTTQD